MRRHILIFDLLIRSNYKKEGLRHCLFKFCRNVRLLPPRIACFQINILPLNALDRVMETMEGSKVVLEIPYRVNETFQVMIGSSDSFRA